MPTTITSRTSYGMHEAWTVRFWSIKPPAEDNSDQRSRTNTIFHSGEGKFGWWIYIICERPAGRLSMTI